MNWLSITIIILIALIALSMFVNYFKGSQNKCDNDYDDAMKSVSHKMIVPLKIQAYERLLLYIERIQFPIIVKRVFNPAISKSDFQFSILQNVQDEFEHNLAQRLYVSEHTWQLIVLAKEEVLQNVNAVFNDNPDADVAMIAHKLASLQNPLVEQAVISIKREFNAL